MKNIKEEMIDNLAKMNLADICDLVKMMEKKFNITAKMSNMNDSSQKDNIKPKEEKTSFDVILTEAGPNKISAIKAVRSVTSLGLKEAKDAVENVPFIIKKEINKKEAKSLKEKIEESGAKVKLK